MYRNKARRRSSKEMSLSSNSQARGRGSRESALASIVTAVNRVSGIYITEISTRLQLVAGNDNLVYVSNSSGDCPELPVTPETASADQDGDPFANNNRDIDTNQAVVDGIIRDANYDLGHVFTTNSGVAGLGVVRWGV